MTISRKDFLKTGSLAALFGSSLFASRTSLSGRKPSKAAKNVIFLVVDGMNIPTLSMADLLHYKQTGGHTHWVELISNPEATGGWMETSPLNAVVTDSAAAASAFGSGHKVNVRSLNISPSGEHHKPILVTAKEAGR
ncbi:MAG: alkaline phosphatase [Balneolales bacterium]|nr:alkaline phosphatase [Balneolales bacterium]